MPNSKMENVDIGDLELIWISEKGKTREVNDYGLYHDLHVWVGKKAVVKRLILMSKKRISMLPNEESQSGRGQSSHASWNR
jgi:hypothetical protein